MAFDATVIRKAVRIAIEYSHFVVDYLKYATDMNSTFFRFER